MKRTLLVILAALLAVGGMPCLQTAGTAADGRKLWATVGDNDTHLLPDSYEKTLKKYTDGTLKEVRSWSGWAWKNDHANSRLDFFTLQEDIPQAALVTGDLVSETGAVIKKENITATYLSKVNTYTEAYPNIDYEVFDVITHDSVKDLEAGQIHEAWVDIYVPEDTPAGVYHGTLSLKVGTQTLVEFAYELEVVDMTLTDPEDWQTYLDLWTTPFASNRYYSGLSDEEYFKFTTKDDTNPYSLYYCHLDKQYEAGLESELELYHQAGGNSITVHIVEGPDNSREPCATPSMIKWTKRTDGTFEFDYTDMDYWIELNMKHGIDRQINFQSLVGVGWCFVYFDEATGKVTNTGAGGVGSNEWNKICRIFLTDLIAHLEEKGWFDISCMYMDERTLEWTTALLDVVESVKNSEGKSLKVGGAVNADEVESVFDRMYDISLWENLATEETKELAEKRRENGQITTLYSCGAGKMSTVNQPAEAAYAVYQSYYYGVDGVLRWALNKFDEDPLYGEIHHIYPGDCYLIYPDEKDSTTMQAQSTPRFEKLCEGMRNVEKLRIIRESYPDFADSVDSLIASLGTKNMVSEASRMRAQILNLSHAIQAFSQKQYTDVDYEAWYMDAARFAVARGLVYGTSSTTLEPDTAMTRAMFVTIMARLRGANVDNSEKTSFDDVPTGQWYSGAISWATKCGLVYGVAPGKFAPHDSLTREQTAAILFRYAEMWRLDTEPRADLSGYKDYDRISSYALEAISWANAKGIMKGVGENTLDPRGSCTRAQIAQMLRIFCKNVLNQF